MISNDWRRFPTSEVWRRDMSTRRLGNRTSFPDKTSEVGSRSPMSPVKTETSEVGQSHECSTPRLKRQVGEGRCNLSGGRCSGCEGDSLLPVASTFALFAMRIGSSAHRSYPLQTTYSPSRHSLRRFGAEVDISDISRWLSFSRGDQKLRDHCFSLNSVRNPFREICKSRGYQEGEHVLSRSFAPLLRT